MTLPEAKPYRPLSDGIEGYANVIWDEHCKRRGSGFPLMSSAEFSLIMGWFQGGIPLRIVLRGLEDTRKSASSLFYYRDPVQQAYSMWRKAIQS